MALPCMWPVLQAAPKQLVDSWQMQNRALWECAPCDSSGHTGTPPVQTASKAKHTPNRAVPARATCRAFKVEHLISNDQHQLTNSSTNGIVTALPRRDTCTR
eukprot:m.227152 g.227152  ORF g.227152 m.227152 type:complete len:102 (-) comp15175_c1_seq1:219-524(-)